jgi:hypothetical protein
MQFLGPNAFFQVEKKMAAITRLSQTHLNNPHTAQNTDLDVASPRYSWDKSRFRSREDEVSFSRWRLGFFVVYGVTVSLLAGLAVVSVRPATTASATAPSSQAMAWADSKGHH